MKTAISAVGVVIFFTLGACGGATKTSSHPATQSITTSAPAATSGSSAQQPPKRLTPGSVKAAIAWFSSGGNDLISALKTDKDALISTPAVPHASALVPVCDRLKSDTLGAQRYAPIPYASFQVVWKAALSGFSSAATDCVAGANLLDPDTSSKPGLDLINRSSAEFTSASTNLDEITRMLTGAS